MPAAPPLPRRELLPLAGANFTAGVGTFIVAAMLGPLADALGTSIAAAGQLVAGYAVALAVGAPLIAAATSRIDRRTLLVGAVVLFGLLHFAAAAAPGYASLFALRFVTGFVAATVTPQAASTAALLAPAQRGQALGFVFLGFSLATVAGVPIGSWLAALGGWRLPMVAVGVLALACAAWLWRRLPAGLFIAPMDAAAWLRLARHRTLLLVVAVTVVQGSGQFVLYTYLGPLLTEQAGVPPAWAGAAFGWLGVWGVLGNVIGARLADRIGPARVVGGSLWLFALAFALWPLIAWSHTALATPLHWALAGAVSALWALPVFACNAAQQARLVTLAPELASASVALNSSGIFLGQAIGAALGGWVITRQGMDSLSHWALGLMLAAIVVSALAARRSVVRPVQA